MSMSTVFFLVGTAAYAVGVAGLAITMLRYVGGRVPRWKAVVDALFAAGAAVVGLYLILDMAILLPLWAGLITAAALYDTRRKRELREGSGEHRLDG